MLSLNLKSLEYIRIGSDTFIQVLPDGDQVKLLIDAPREVPVLRGTLLEEQGIERPQALKQKLPKKRRDRSSPSYHRHLEQHAAKVDLWQESRKTARAAIERIREKLNRPEADAVRGEILRELEWIEPLATTGYIMKEARDEPGERPRTAAHNDKGTLVSDAGAGGDHRQDD